jgi:hypothetical protein
VSIEICSGIRTIFLVAAAFLATFASASAQEPAASLGALAERLQIGQLVWVTDPTGREVHGKLEQLSSDRLVVTTNGSETFAAADVWRVRTRDRDSIKNGALIGLGIGGALGTAWCIGAIADDSGDIDARVECAEGFIVHPALGALLGLAVDRVIPGKMRVIYQASVPHGASGAILGLAPFISARAKGLAVLFAF